MNLNRISRTVPLLAAALLLFPQEAHAYLDPGSGSLIVQALVAAFFALSLAMPPTILVQYKGLSP